MTSHMAAANRLFSEPPATDYLEGLLEGFVAYDANWHMTYMNAAAERILGRQRSDVLGKTWHEAFPHAVGNPVDRMYQRVMRTRVGERIELFYERYGRWFEISSSPVKDGGVAVYFRDISDRMCAADALREETRTLETLNRVGKALAAELDLERVVQAVTDAATELSGAAFGAFFYNVTNENGASYMLYTLSGAPREAFSRFPMPRNTEVFAPTFSGTTIVRSDDITKDARYGKSAPHYGMPSGHLPVRSYLAVPVVSRSGEVLGGLFFGHPEPGVFTERSERVVSAIASQAAIAIDNARLYGDLATAKDHLARQVEELQRAQELLREADRRKDEFLAILAHELRNPLAPIANAVAVLGKKMPNVPELEWCHHVIQRQVQHMSRLIDDLMEIERISHGKLSVRKERVSLNRVIDASLETSGPLITAAQHHLSVVMPAQTVHLDADAVRVAQALSNLLNNAAKFTPDGGSIHLSAGVEGDHQVAISIEDSGMGFEPEAASRLFKPFSQLPGAEERSGGGLGIGLNLVQAIVALHGGTVEARSEGRNRGCTFVVRLPITSEKSAASTDPAAPLG